MNEVTRETESWEAIVEEIECLARSPNRVRLLDTIRDQGPIRKGDLQEQFEISRTTVSRNLAMLEERGWIETPAPRTYALSCTGDLVSAAFSDLLAVVRLSKRLQPFLQWVPQAEFDVDLRSLADADVVVSTASDPYVPVQRHVEAIKRAGRVRLLLSAIGQQALEAASRRVLDGEAEYEVVVTSGVEDAINENPRYAELIGEQLATGRLDVFVYDGAIPYYVGLLDDLVQIGAEDQQGVPRALLETDAERVRKWAEREYAEYKREARPLDLAARTAEETVATSSHD